MHYKIGGLFYNKASLKKLIGESLASFQFSPKRKNVKLSPFLEKEKVSINDMSKF